jgi:hypothetical protein
VRSAANILTSQKSAILGAVAADKKVTPAASPRLARARCSRARAHPGPRQRCGLHAEAPGAPPPHQPLPSQRRLCLPQAEGEAAYAKLEKSLTEFQGLIDAKDKQQVPIKQRE